MKSWIGAWVGLGAAVLAGCAAVAPQPGPPGPVQGTPWAVQSDPHAVPGRAPARPAEPGWHHLSFPGKAATRFHYDRKDGRDALAVHASSSASMLRNKVRLEPADLAALRFSWKVPQLIEGADLALREADDSPVRVVLFFEGDRSRFSGRDALLAELVRTVTGEEMPYATLMYVWCNRREPGTVVASPRTGRVQTIVVESGTRRLDQWVDYERDIRADYQRAFGEPPGALVGIGIMSDSDNTRSTLQAWYGPLRLQGAALR
jgi:hypothetical protein